MCNAKKCDICGAYYDIGFSKSASNNLGELDFNAMVLKWVYKSGVLHHARELDVCRDCCDAINSVLLQRGEKKND